MTEHTPKPWQLARFDPATCFIEVETVERGTDVPDQGYFVAKMYAGPIGPNGDNYLVKAAPDLLDACKGAENWLSEFSDGSDDGLIGLLGDLRDAIRKAEGAE